MIRPIAARSKENTPFGDRMEVKALRSSRRPVSLEELEAIYRREGAAFERVAIAIVGDEQLGCDAVHDAFVLAVRGRRSFRREAPVEAWLWRIVINEARKAWSYESRMLATRPEELDTAVDSQNGAGDRMRLRALIAALPERQRLALFLRHYADLDYEAIAQALGVRPGTVAATLSTARKRLRGQLEKLEEVNEWEL
jgi:RNA polymerase sigma-70 factor (ECF subfamily)